LILQNEPCQRHFCFYKFPTNRPASYRPLEVELERQGIINTIAEPYPGSRPETLFGMIENQKIPLTEVLRILTSKGAVEWLSIDSTVCMSKFDKYIHPVHNVHLFSLAGGIRSKLRGIKSEISSLMMALLRFFTAPRGVEGTSQMIKCELVRRLEIARKFLTPTDEALGYRFPTQLEIAEMAQSMALRLDALPKTRSREYEIAVAELFGGSFTAVMCKYPETNLAIHLDQLRYSNGERSGVVVAYPPELMKIFNLTHDLLPDIQDAEPELISQYYPSNEWTLEGNADLRYLVLTTQTGSIKLKNCRHERSRFVVLMRVYGAPIQSPFRIQLSANQNEIASADIYQAESLLLRGEIIAHGETQLTLHVCYLNGTPLGTMPPVSVAAVRVASIATDR
jgi:hypothetical protein